MTTIKNVTEKKKQKKRLKNLIRFPTGNKIEAGIKGKERKKSKRIYRTSQKIRIINVFLESLLPVLSRAGNHSPPLPS